MALSKNPHDFSDFQELEFRKKWQCEKSLSEISFDSMLRWWYPGVLASTAEPRDEFNHDHPGGRIGEIQR